MQQFILGFIPDVLRRDADVFRRARLIVTTAFISALIAALYIIQYLFVTVSIVSALSLAITVCSLLCVPFAVRNSGSLRLAGNWVVLTYLTVLALLCYFEGGSEAQARYWLVMIPLLAILLVTDR